MKDVGRELLVVLKKVEKLILKLKKIRNVGYFGECLQSSPGTVISLHDVMAGSFHFGEKKFQERSTLTSESTSFIRTSWWPP